MPLIVLSSYSDSFLFVFQFHILSVCNRIVSLNVQNNQFTGSFPSEIGKLSNAISLSFSSNALSGTIPKEIGTLENLENFDASSNFLAEQLPDAFGGLVYLKNFDMALNYLSGTLPPTLISNTTVLNALNVSGNVLGSNLPIPENLGQMTSLQSLDLSTNQFAGSVPESIGEMENLIELRLDRNVITGKLPESMNRLSNIKVLSLSENSITELPLGLTSLTKLEELYLSSNLLDEIPEEIFNNLESLGKLLRKGDLMNMICDRILTFCPLSCIYCCRNTECFKKRDRWNYVSRIV